MDTESYDITRMASLILHFVLGLGASTDDALRALQLTERMLRDARDEEAARGGARNRGYRMAAAE